MTVRFYLCLWSCVILKNFLPNCVSPRINSCPNNCSGHGRCSTANSVLGRVYCECDEYWKGEACDIPYCRDNCGSPDHGYCDLTGEKLCVCNDSWQGKETGQTERAGQSRGLNFIRQITKEKWMKWGGCRETFGPTGVQPELQVLTLWPGAEGLCREEWAEGKEKAKGCSKCYIRAKSLLILVICMWVSTG